MDQNVYKPLLPKNDRIAYIIIGSFSVAIFLAVTALTKIKIHSELGFNPHIFAKINAVINFTVACLLPLGVYLAKTKRLLAHRRTMLGAISLSSVFLISYVLHHLLTETTSYPKDAGTIRYFYFAILATHIILAAVILPFILFTAYRAATADFIAHRKLAKITFPIWWYVSISGVIVYLMISPYYQ